MTAPLNDNFQDAIQLVTTQGRLTGSNVDATQQVEAQGIGADVWFYWTAPETGTITLDTFGSQIATALAIYEKTGTALGAQLEISSASFTAMQSITVREVIAGTEYYIAVGSPDVIAPIVGDWVLNWSFVAGAYNYATFRLFASTYDDVADAQRLIELSTDANGDYLISGIPDDSGFELTILQDRLLFDAVTLQAIGIREWHLHTLDNGLGGNPEKFSCNDCLVVNVTLTSDENTTKDATANNRYTYSLTYRGPTYDGTADANFVSGIRDEYTFSRTLAVATVPDALYSIADDKKTIAIYDTRDINLLSDDVTNTFSIRFVNAKKPKQGLPGEGFMYGQNASPCIITSPQSNGFRGYSSNAISSTIELKDEGDSIELMFDTNNDVWQVVTKSFAKPAEHMKYLLCRTDADYSVYANSSVPLLATFTEYAQNYWAPSGHSTFPPGALVIDNESSGLSTFMPRTPGLYLVQIDLVLDVQSADPILLEINLNGSGSTESTQDVYVANHSFADMYNQSLFKRSVVFTQFINVYGVNISITNKHASDAVRILAGTSAQFVKLLDIDAYIPA